MNSNITANLNTTGISNVGSGTFLTIPNSVTTSPQWTTTSTSYTYTSPELLSFTIINFLTEQELHEVLKRAKELKEDEVKWLNLLKEIVFSRHLSEDFLMTYIDMLTYDDIKVLHLSDLASGAYSEILLYFKLK